MKKKNITVTEIAKAVELSISTVSRALSNHPKISRRTKEKVWNTAKKMGYQPKIPAYMEPKSSKIICVLVPELKSQFQIDIIEGIQKTAINKGFHVYLGYTKNDTELEKMYTRSLAEMNIDGVISIVFNKSAGLDHLNTLYQLNIPTVLINRSDHDHQGCTIIPDVSLGTYKAVKHLVSMGCRDILLFTGNPENPFFADMTEGYRTAVSEEKIKDHIIIEKKNQSDPEKVLNELKNKDQFPDGIICPDTASRKTITGWLKSNGLKMPDDLKLISFNDLQKKSINASKITTIHFSGTETGEKAAAILFQQINSGKLLKETVIIPAKLIIKSSSLKLG